MYICSSNSSVIKPIDKTKKSTESEMSFFEHLEELRWHFIRSFGAIGVLALIMFSLKSFVFNYIIFAPKNEWFPSYQFFQRFIPNFAPPEMDLITRDFGESFFVHIKVSLWLYLKSNWLSNRAAQQTRIPYTSNEIVNIWNQNIANTLRVFYFR